MVLATDRVEVAGRAQVVERVALTGARTADGISALLLERCAVLGASHPASGGEAGPRVHVYAFDGIERTTRGGGLWTGMCELSPFTGGHVDVVINPVRVAALRGEASGEKPPDPDEAHRRRLYSELIAARREFLVSPREPDLARSGAIGSLASGYARVVVTDAHGIRKRRLVSIEWEAWDRAWPLPDR